MWMYGGWFYQKVRQLMPQKESSHPESTQAMVTGPRCARADETVPGDWQHHHQGKVFDFNMIYPWVS